MPNLRFGATVPRLEGRSPSSRTHAGARKSFTGSRNGSCRRGYAFIAPPDPRAISIVKPPGRRLRAGVGRAGVAI